MFHLGYGCQWIQEKYKYFLSQHYSVDPSSVYDLAPPPNFFAQHCGVTTFPYTLLELYFLKHILQLGLH